VPRRWSSAAGGKLLATARANDIPAFVFAYESTVRGALGFGLMPLLAVADKLGMVGSKATMSRRPRSSWSTWLAASPNTCP